MLPAALLQTSISDLTSGYLAQEQPSVFLPLPGLSRVLRAAHAAIPHDGSGIGVPREHRDGYAAANLGGLVLHGHTAQRTATTEPPQQGQAPRELGVDLVSTLMLGSSSGAGVPVPHCSW